MASATNYSHPLRCERLGSKERAVAVPFQGPTTALSHLNTNFDSEGPMALVLVGQNELWDNKLRLQRYAAVRQRIDLYCSLPRLSRSETGDYIRYQIRYSQCGKEIFTEDALGTIYDAAGGIMRVINQICKKCLMYASQVKQTTINADMVRYVVQHEMPAMDDPDLTGRS